MRHSGNQDYTIVTVNDLKTEFDLMLMISNSYWLMMAAKSSSMLWKLSSPANCIPGGTKLNNSSLLKVFKFYPLTAVS